MRSASQCAGLKGIAASRKYAVNEALAPCNDARVPASGNTRLGPAMATRVRRRAIVVDSHPVVRLYSKRIRVPLEHLRPLLPERCSRCSLTTASFPKKENDMTTQHRQVITNILVSALVAVGSYVGGAAPA